MFKFIHNRLSEARSVKVLSWDQSQDTIKTATAIYQLLKILTILIRAHDGHAGCCLNWSVYDINVNCECYIKCLQKINVIARIRCYF